MTERMKTEGVDADDYTNTMLIKILTLQNKLDEAVSVLNEMEKQNCAALVVPYSAIVNAYASRRMMDKALIYVKRMESKVCIHVTD